MKPTKHPRLAQQELLLNILLSFKAEGRTFTIDECIRASSGVLKYGMVNYHLNSLLQEAKLQLLKKRPNKIKRFCFPNH